MTAPTPALHTDPGGTTLVRLGVNRFTALDARRLAYELLETADLTDHANGVSPVAAPFVPATPESIDDTADGA